MLLKNILGAIAAFFLVANQFFSYPVFAEDVISGNAAASDNQISQSQIVKDAVTQINNLKLTNNISIHASTGGNEASGNGGDVTIVTGNVNISAKVYNQSLDTSSVSIPKPKILAIVKEQENGSDSTNSVEENLSSEEEQVVVNNTELSNKINVDSTTGENKTEDNTGKVYILTGNVYLNIILSSQTNYSTSGFVKPSLTNLFNPLN